MIEALTDNTAMVEIRVLHLPVPEPLRLRPASTALPGASLRPLGRGLVFLAALSLPALGCTLADRFHGAASKTVQVVAVPLTTPQSGAAANVHGAASAAVVPAASLQAMLAQPKLSQSLVLR